MSTPDPIIAVLCGGSSSEREVSLGSGHACALALARSYPVRLFEIETDALPPDLDADRHVVFSTLHGGFGENGGMQALLDAAGIHYAGCDRQSSELTMDKARTKEVVAAHGVRVAEGVVFTAPDIPEVDELVARLGEDVVLKPNDEGSSVGLTLVRSRDELALALQRITRGTWMAERRVIGRELSVGVIEGTALGVVEIRPKSGLYDFASKYTRGLTEYFAPACIGDSPTAVARRVAEAAFAACGCRDYARVDFILDEEEAVPVLLEINTLPGMKETSLLPKSAGVEGLDFDALLRRLVGPALARHRAARALRTAAISRS